MVAHPSWEAKGTWNLEADDYHVPPDSSFLLNIHLRPQVFPS